MTFDSLVSARRSIRAFTAQSIPRDVIEKLLGTAARSPSGGNVQPWHVYVVTDEARNKLVADVMEQLPNNPAGEGTEYNIYPPGEVEPYMARRRKVAYDMYQLLNIERGDRMGRAVAMAKNFDFFGAPVGLFFTVDRIMDKDQWADVGGFIQTFMLAAVDAGLATCPQEAWATWHKTVGRHIGIPQEQMLFCGMALGYEDTSAAVNQLHTERAAVSEFATFLNS